MIFFSGKQRGEREAAYRLYAAAADAARDPAFFTVLGVADTLQGRFEMVVLHLFPLIHRLMHDPGDAPDLARALSECFVDEMDSAFRDIGVADTRVPKRMKIAFRSFAGRIAAYGASLKEGDDALADAIARNVFPDGGGETASMSLAQHIRQTVAAVQARDLAALQRGEVVFPPAVLEALA